jgi:hypothetical protein
MLLKVVLEHLMIMHQQKMISFNLERKSRLHREEYCEKLRKMSCHIDPQLWQ